MTALVVGATGVVDFDICRRLRQDGHRVRALVRRGAARERALTELGVEIAYGDLKDADSLQRACAGRDVVVSTATCTMSRQPGDTLKSVDRDGNLRLVQAAEASRLLRPVAPIPAALIALGVWSARHGDVIDMAGTLREFDVRLRGVREYMASLRR